MDWETRSVLTFWLVTFCLVTFWLVTFWLGNQICGDILVDHWECVSVPVQMLKSIRVKIPFETFIEITRDNIARAINKRKHIFGNWPRWRTRYVAAHWVCSSQSASENVWILMWYELANPVISPQQIFIIFFREISDVVEHTLLSQFRISNQSCLPCS